MNKHSELSVHFSLLYVQVRQDFSQQSKLPRSAKAEGSTCVSSFQHWKNKEQVSLSSAQEFMRCCVRLGLEICSFSLSLLYPVPAPWLRCPTSQPSHRDRDLGRRNFLSLNPSFHTKSIVSHLDIPGHRSYVTSFHASLLRKQERINSEVLKLIIIFEFWHGENLSACFSLNWSLGW